MKTPTEMAQGAWTRYSSGVKLLGVEQLVRETIEIRDAEWADEVQALQRRVTELERTVKEANQSIASLRRALTREQDLE
jgi:uncharacterized protein YlxW (UPF0749 family)